MALEYLKASAAYMEKTSPLPLPIGYPGLPDNWVWNGYYIRQLNSPALNFFGAVAIRVAFDKNSGIHHAFFPTFIIPHLTISTYDLQIFIGKFLKCFIVADAIEKFSNSCTAEYFDLPISSAYFLLSWFVRKCRDWLSIMTSTNSVLELKNFDNQVLHRFIFNLHARSPPD